jgi:hypothetical protein
MAAVAREAPPQAKSEAEHGRDCDGYRHGAGNAAGARDHRDNANPKSNSPRAGRTEQNRKNSRTGDCTKGDGGVDGRSGRGVHCGGGINRDEGL